LPSIVITPAHYLSIDHDSTGVIQTGGNIRYIGQRLDRGITVNGCAIPKLTLGVLTPAPHIATSEHTGVIATGNYGFASTYPKYIHGDVTAIVHTVAKLSKVIISPTLDSTFGRDCAGMGDTGGNGMSFPACHRDEACERH